MIKGLQGISGLTVTGGNTSVPYINQNNNNPIQGMLRVWGNDMQVFDGNSWINMSTSYATVGLDQDVLDIVQWARKKRAQEDEWYKLASSNEAVRIALDQLEQAKTRLELTTILAREHETATS
jgi:hypothetical protein